MSQPPVPTTIISSTTDLQSLLSKIPALPTSPPSLYVSIVGNGSYYGQPGERFGFLCLYIPPHNKIYLIDIQQLGEGVFTITAPTNTAPTPDDESGNTTSTSLKAILESPTIPKVFGSITSECRALDWRFGVSVAGVHATFILQWAASRYTCFNIGLSECVARHAPAPVANEYLYLHLREEAAYRAIKGSGDVPIKQRPLHEDIFLGLVNTLIPLPVLFRVYTDMLSAPDMKEYRDTVQSKTEDWIAEVLRR
ncbi:hypothetical protein FQN52_003497 [Onygenales sp. PD_12]|nr:hypothetical protein FQN52_003497 [Onygenales sp. PD_12]